VVEEKFFLNLLELEHQRIQLVEFALAFRCQAVEV
jgi:hypothetical protein